MVWYLLALIFFLALDLISKYIAVHYLQDVIPVCSMLRLNLEINKGIAFGLFSDAGDSSQNSFVLIVGLVLIIFMWHMIRRLHARRNILPEIIVCAGGLGNLISRAIYGGVVDFLEVSLCSHASSILNIADIYISVGLGVILLRVILYEPT